MNKNVSLLLAGVVILSGCATSAPTQTSYRGVHPLKLSNDVTNDFSYIQVNGAKFTFPEQCLLTRQMGDLADNRLHGDQADNRLHGDQADNRLHGDQADNRLHGDQADNRLHGDQADNRLHGDQADNRLHGDQADNRLHGDQADNRLHGDQADNRLHGDQADNRLHGDQADSRLHGDLANKLRCSKVNNINGVVVTGFTGTEIIDVNLGSQFGSFNQSKNVIILKF